jgi:hypothetical protein
MANIVVEYNYDVQHEFNTNNQRYRLGLLEYCKKPLQGGPFRRMRDRRMNSDPSSPYHSSSHRRVLKGGNDLDDQNDLDDRTEQVDLASSQDDLKQAGCGNSKSDFMDGIPGHGDIGEIHGDVSNPWVLVTRKRGNKEDIR